MAKRRAVVVGAGVSGLTCAKELCSRGWEVSLVAQHDPLDKETCSQGAGGLWMPFHVEPALECAEWARQTLDVLLQEKSSGSERAEFIEVLPCLVLKTAPTPASELPPWAGIPELGFEVLSREELARKKPGVAVPAAFWGGWSFETPVINVRPYLSSLLSELRAAGVAVTFGERFANLAEAVGSGERHLSGSAHAVVNCTGLGADVVSPHADTMTPGRGVVMIMERPADVNAVLLCESAPFTERSPAYAIPRGPHHVTVGGTYLEGDWRKEPTEEELSDVLRKAAFLYPSLADAKVVETWVGHRPVRHAGVRLGAELLDLPGGPAPRKVAVAHNYGHGGSGWTINYGCATATVDALEAVLESASAVDL
mmetsp:Transcript_31028/g.82180  ORF Transcript_31028/g.82180 Transcript_31028/m.82180 type:complete len:368 (-) Transcript_31028:66-1169(-)